MKEKYTINVRREADMKKIENEVDRIVEIKIYGDSELCHDEEIYDYYEEDINKIADDIYENLLKEVVDEFEKSLYSAPKDPYSVHGLFDLSELKKSINKSSCGYDTVYCTKRFAESIRKNTPLIPTECKYTPDNAIILINSDDMDYKKLIKPNRVISRGE